MPLSGNHHWKLHEDPWHKSDAGTARGGYRLGCGIDELLAVFMGSLGMAVISQEWGDTVKVLGAMNILVGFSCLGLCVLLAGRPFVKQIPEKKLDSDCLE
jgi:hypothetical protein